MTILYRVLILGCLFFATLPAAMAYTADVPGDYSASDVEYEYGKHLCQLPQYYCREVHDGDTWRSLFKDPREREIVMRLNRSNTALRYLKWIVIPRNIENVSYNQLSPMPGKIDPPGHNVLIVNLRKYAFGAYNAEGERVFWGPATGGMSWCKDLGESCASETGIFKIYRMQGPECVSSRFPVDRADGGAPMPYCMHYYQGFALHGSTLSGFINRSRGCVRLFYDDAKWINQHFAKIGTEVIVKR